MIRRGALSATATVADVLRWAAGRRESGGLHLEGPVAGAIYLLDGDICFADSGRGLPMDQQLVASGVLTREQRTNVMEQVKAGRDLAFVLESEPGVHFRKAVSVIRERSTSAIADLLDCTTGTYLLDRYDQHPYGILGHWPVSSMLEIAQAKRVDLLDEGAGQLLRLVPQAVPGAGGSDDVVLTADELRLLIGATGRQTLQDVANANGVSLADAVRLARKLVSRGLLRLAPPAAAPPAPDLPDLFEVEQPGATLADAG